VAFPPVQLVTLPPARASCLPSRTVGQHPLYMQGMLKLFKVKSEFTTPYAWIMNLVATKLTPAEMKAVTEYASTLK
jgi:cytochrome c553